MPATRVVVRLVEIIVAAHEAGARRPADPPASAADPADVVADAIAFIAERGQTDHEHLPELVMRTLMAWSASDYDAFFEQTDVRLAGDLRLASSA